MLKVNDIFHSIQGEGVFAGQLTTFIRLSGCNVKCNIKKFCDTDYNSGELLSEDYILSKIKHRIVCITGGEPLEQDIEKLCYTLRANGHQVHLQTSGTIDISKDLYALTNHVVCSPKLPVSKLRLHRCDEIKVVYIGQDINQYYKYGDANNHYIQPLEKEGSYNTNEVLVEMEKHINNKWVLSVQTHKLLGLR